MAVDGLVVGSWLAYQVSRFNHPADATEHPPVRQTYSKNMQDKTCGSKLLLARRSGCGKKYQEKISLPYNGQNWGIPFRLNAIETPHITDWGRVANS